MSGAPSSEFPLLFLMGPTAIGKTAVAMALAQALDGEIINVDSAQVYRVMSIGTAKPSATERCVVPHHLLDIVEPEEAYSAARFCADALRCIADIRGRGRTPILAGGTMLYFKALERGLAPLPEADPAIRAELENEAARIGWDALHQRLQQIDPVAAQRIHPNDPQRIARALEVYRLCGKTLTDLLAETHSLLPEPVVKFALMPSLRPWLHARIEQRFHQMLAAGFLDEVRQLRQRVQLHAQLPSMRSVGYRQAWNHLDGETDYPSFVEQGIAATRQLAKRQMTWVRGMDDVHQIPCTDEQDLSSRTQAVLAQLPNT